LIMSHFLSHFQQVFHLYVPLRLKKFITTCSFFKSQNQYTWQTNDLRYFGKWFFSIFRRLLNIPTNKSCSTRDVKMENWKIVCSQINDMRVRILSICKA
jgi:hypothetical protein